MKTIPFLFFLLLLFSCGKLKEISGMAEEATKGTKSFKRAGVDPERNRGITFCDRSIFIQQNIIKQLTEDYHLDIESCSTVTNSHLMLISVITIDTVYNLELKDGDLDDLFNLYSLTFQVHTFKSQPSVFRDLKSLSDFAIVQKSFSHDELWIETKEIKLPLGLFDGLNNLNNIYIKGGNDKYGVTQGVYNLPDQLLEDLINLKKFTLVNNMIKTLPVNIFNKNISLKEINLDNNNFTSINKNTFDKLDSLLFLYIRNNHIISIQSDAFNGLTNLLFLDLQENKISIIKDSAFSNLSSLIKLELSYNRVQTITNKTFEKLESLESLYLNNNKVTISHNKANNNNKQHSEYYSIWHNIK